MVYQQELFVGLNLQIQAQKKIPPHCDEIGKKESTKLQLKDKDVIGIMISNGCAIEIVDNKFKIIKESPNSKAYKAFWKNNEYYEIELNNLTMEKN